MSIHSLYKISKYKRKDSETQPRLSTLGTGAWERMNGRAFYKSPDQGAHSYVAPDAEAVPVIIVYGVLTLIMLFILWRVWKKIGKQIDYDAIRANW